MLNLLVAILVALTLSAFDTSAVSTPVHLHFCILAATMIPLANVKPLLHAIRDVMAALSCSRTTVYVLINSGQLDAVKILGATRITDASLRKLLEAAPAAEIAGNAALAEPPPQPRKRASSRRIAV